MGERQPRIVLSRDFGPEDLSAVLGTSSIELKAEEPDIIHESRPEKSSDRFKPIFASSMNGQSQQDRKGNQLKLPDRTEMLARVIGPRRAVWVATGLAAVGIAATVRSLRSLGTGAVGVGRAVVERIGGLI